ncbi:MAG: hypothetical protein D6800_06645 [Candidatus Zixiibacteriota bacterium]|nr:MAG: hypothetical protein D6800_06645 [candidate division Zixibacteria bacterium]
MSLQRVAEYVHLWLEGLERDRVLLVVIEHDRGLDLAGKLWKMRMGDFSSVDVPFDALPAAAVNAYVNRYVYIVSQPDHLDTVMVSMHDPEADWAVRKLTEDEIRKVGLPENSYSHLVKQPYDTLSPRTVDEVVVDMEVPFWEALLPIMGDRTMVRMTPRVRRKPGDPA